MGRSLTIMISPQIRGKKAMKRSKEDIRFIPIFIYFMTFLSTSKT